MSLSRKRIDRLEAKIGLRKEMPPGVLERLRAEPVEVQTYATNIVQTGRANAPLLEVLLGRQSPEVVDVMHLGRAYAILERETPRVEEYMARLIEVG